MLNIKLNNINVWYLKFNLLGSKTRTSSAPKPTPQQMPEPRIRWNRKFKASQSKWDARGLSADCPRKSWARGTSLRDPPHRNRVLAFLCKPYSPTCGTHFWQAKVRWGAKHSPPTGKTFFAQQAKQKAKRCNENVCVHVKRYTCVHICVYFYIEMRICKYIRI